MCLWAGRTGGASTGRLREAQRRESTKGAGKGGNPKVRSLELGDTRSEAGSSVIVSSAGASSTGYMTEQIAAAVKKLAQEKLLAIPARSSTSSASEGTGWRVERDPDGQRLRWAT
jgi:hypothetical protein